MKIKSKIITIWITKTEWLQFFSCLFAFSSSFSIFCWKNKCYKKQVPSLKIDSASSLEINFYIFQNQLKKVWDKTIWGQNSHLNFHKTTFWPNPSQAKPSQAELTSSEQARGGRQTKCAREREKYFRKL